MEYFEIRKKALISSANVFWLPTGVPRDMVFAAYRFKGVSSEDFALQDLSSYRRQLMKYSQTDTAMSTGTHTPAWNSSSGFTFDAVYQGLSGYLDNPALDQSDIKAAVVCYTGLTQTNRGYLITAGGASGKAQIFAATTMYIQGGSAENYTGPGYVTAAYADYNFVGTAAYNSTAKTSGVIGANFGSTGGLYLDGSAAATTSTASGDTYTDIDGGHQGFTFGNSHTDKSDLNNAVHAGKTIIAAAFFGVELTADQHLEIATAMLAL